MKIKKFNFKKNLCDNYSMLITAKRRSGKTVLLKHIVEQTKNQYKNIYLFTESEFCNEYNFITKENIFVSINEIVLNNIINKQKNYIQKDLNHIYRTKNMDSLLCNEQNNPPFSHHPIHQQPIKNDDFA